MQTLFQQPHIALYNILRKVDGVTDAEAKEAEANIADSKKVATKADIKDMATKTDLANLETRLVKQMYAVGGMVIAAVGIIVALIVKL